MSIWGVGKELKDDISKETAVTGRIHVCDACVAPCDDPADGRSNWLARVGKFFTGGHDDRAEFVLI